MKVIQQEEWVKVQTSIDTCGRCRSETLFDTNNITPARPWNPMHPGRLLLIPENPPITGGFWETSNEDGFRQNIFHFLKISINSDHNETLKSFLSYRYPGDLRFFLIQTFKWPYAKALGQQKKGYNQSRSSESMRRILDHTVSAHLEPEISAIHPIGILAMGRAAWDACRELSKNKSQLPSAGIETIRGHLYTLQLDSRSIPLDVTHLPVGRNVTYPKRAGEISKDFENFLNRHLRHATG